MATSFDTIPGVAAPARRALASAGYSDLESLDGVPYEDIANLHGVGARSLERLQSALNAAGKSLGGEVPEPASRDAVYTEGHTGKNAADIKTTQTAETPEEYIESLDSERRVRDGRLLLELFNRVTGEEPVMWGPSMIGYGQVHYKYATGREGDTFKLGFSPRKAKLSLYGLTGIDGGEQYLNRLGKHSVGASCLYVNKPEDIDLEVLAELVGLAWNSEPGAC
ncbi:DUF1801 domain-containing protein [Gulosibacter molinativorax]|uniref:YdhG-like domain-containing protein n=1 Tax=Gulosibacter molinativorax TaxID=256821 RepID=A0ABT7C5N0_9MICO|nr:DUF1801 domain-containing protein [Gulosibacter molinativorax]MDJ1370507.1 hypothetical protein [Gulosibacter molinativorax]QUY62082.1 Putative uncharacterized protein [Gulosibacter molinativorax]